LPGKDEGRGLLANHEREHPGQPDKGNRLEGLQMQDQSVQPGAKRRALHKGAANPHPTMTPHKRRYGRRVDLIVFAPSQALLCNALPGSG
jgi:hypothetical protein